MFLILNLCIAYVNTLDQSFFEISPKLFVNYKTHIVEICGIDLLFIKLANDKSLSFPVLLAWDT